MREGSSFLVLALQDCLGGLFSIQIYYRIIGLASHAKRGGERKVWVFSEYYLFPFGKGYISLVPESNCHGFTHSVRALRWKRFELRIGSPNIPDDQVLMEGCAPLGYPLWERTWRTVGLGAGEQVLREPDMSFQGLLLQDEYI